MTCRHRMLADLPGSNLPHAGFGPTVGWTTRQELVGRNVFTSGQGRHELYADPGSPPVIHFKSQAVVITSTTFNNEFPFPGLIQSAFYAVAGWL